jgi:hypothetical protein
MAVQIQVRRGSAALWAEVNPILAEGELALELDTQKFKIGNGILHWNDLAYASGPPGPQGPQGIPGNQINKVIEIPDVVAGDLLDGSLLIYDATTEQWNVQTTLFGQNMDGGEF